MSQSPERHRAKRRFGQNFLIDQSVIANIVGCVAPLPTQQLLEIGPGLGALTQPLLASGAYLTALEIDRDLIGKLADRFAAYPRLRLLQADALEFDFTTAADGPDKLRIIGNLPYNISTPLLIRLLAACHKLQDLHVMVQKEVALRLAAEPGTADFGRLTVAAQSVCDVELLFDIEPESFRPAPSIVSSIVRLTPRQSLPSNETLLALERVTRIAFAHRRKMIRHTLGQAFSAAELDALGIEMTVRPENLSVAHYVALASLEMTRGHYA